MCWRCDQKNYRKNALKRADELEPKDLPFYKKFPDIWEIEGVMISFPKPAKNPNCMHECQYKKYDLPFIQPSCSLSYYKPAMKKDAKSESYRDSSDSEYSEYKKPQDKKPSTLAEFLDLEEKELRKLDQEEIFDMDNMFGWQLRRIVKVRFRLSKILKNSD